ncbi:zinc finger CCCH domain-containing protein 16-like isoform X1 [Salvia splendens]|nr:zinc finger CCCH domain-containing protein 16-like isoform X1 [Salvia splendens]
MAPVVSFFTPRHSKVRAILLDLALKLVVLQIHSQTLLVLALKLVVLQIRSQTLLVLVFRAVHTQEGVMALYPNQIKSRFFLWFFKQLIVFVVYRVDISSYSCCQLLCFRFEYIFVTDTLKNYLISKWLILLISFCHPFDNKWSRFSNVNNSSAPASRQANNQPSAANHTCTATDIESCKRVILEDLENEKPLWKLTCYGHSRNGPCDIVGDISYDELRALAYDDAKHGKDIASIVERERNLLNSKLLEFQNLAQNPYPVSSAPTPSSQNMFGGGSTIAPVVNNGFSSQVSSFSQLSGSSNTRSAAAPNFSFGQPNAFQNNTQPSSFQTNNSPFNTPGSFGIQPQHSPQSFSPSGTTSSNNGAISAQQNPFSTPASLPQTGNGAGKQLNFFTNEPISASSSIGLTNTSTQLISFYVLLMLINLLSNNTPKENANVDAGIWTKVEWNVGEIPEEEPPAIYIN